MMMQGLVMGGAADNRIKYGYLYNWYVTQGTGNASIIPSTMSSLGWAVPSYANYNTLFTSLAVGGWAVAGIKLKQSKPDYAYWESIDSATNDYNFSVRGTGFRSTAYNEFLYIRYWGTFFTYDAIIIVFINGIAYADYYNYNAYKNAGSSLRLVRPATAPEQLLPDGTYMDKYVGNDGQKYLTVKIGTQVWLAENLAETKYRNGDAIPNVTDNTAWAALTTGARCAYGNNESNVFI